MSRLKSEIEIVCPCCQSTLVIDTNLARVVSVVEPERGDKPELSDAHRILAEEAARRDAILLAVGRVGEDARRRPLAPVRGGPQAGAPGARDQAHQGLGSGLSGNMVMG